MDTAPERSEWILARTWRFGEGAFLFYCPETKDDFSFNYEWYHQDHVIVPDEPVGIVSAWPSNQFEKSNKRKTPLAYAIIVSEYRPGCILHDSFDKMFELKSSFFLGVRLFIVDTENNDAIAILSWGVLNSRIRCGNGKKLPLFTMSRQYSHSRFADKSFQYAYYLNTVNPVPYFLVCVLAVAAELLRQELLRPT